MFADKGTVCQQIEEIQLSFIPNFRKELEKGGKKGEKGGKGGEDLIIFHLTYFSWLGTRTKLKRQIRG